MLVINVLSDMIEELLEYLREADELKDLSANQVRGILLAIDLLAEKIWNADEQALIELSEQVEAKAAELVGFHYDFQAVLKQVSAFDGDEPVDQDEVAIDRLEKQLNRIYRVIENRVDE